MAADAGEAKGFEAPIEMKLRNCFIKYKRGLASRFQPILGESKRSGSLTAALSPCALRPSPCALRPARLSCLPSGGHSLIKRLVRSANQSGQCRKFPQNIGGQIWSCHLVTALKVVLKRLKYSIFLLSSTLLQPFVLFSHRNDFCCQENSS